jgi:hypothetical protein
LSGANQDNETVVEPFAVIVGCGGAAGGLAATVAADGADEVPAPSALTAETRNRYEDPVSRPVTVAVVAVEVPSLKTVQVVPLVEYSIL